MIWLIFTTDKFICPNKDFLSPISLYVCLAEHMPEALALTDNTVTYLHLNL